MSCPSYIMAGDNCSNIYVHHYMFKQLLREFESLTNPAQAKNLQRFFKTGKGEYGEGDVFLGLTVPQQRILAKKYLNITSEEAEELLHSKIHEQRLTALIILTIKYNKNPEERKPIYQLYLRNTKHINNWDLVDLSAPRIVGEYLLDKDRSILRTLVQSKLLWERRIAVLATFTFISKKQFRDSLELAEILLHDQHDLIHKAVGWMLREIGKRELAVEEKFLQKHYRQMPRTMLRYAIEKFPEEKRKKYLHGTISLQ